MIEQFIDKPLAWVYTSLSTLLMKASEFPKSSTIVAITAVFAVMYELNR